MNSAKYTFSDTDNIAMKDVSKLITEDLETVYYPTRVKRDSRALIRIFIFGLIFLIIGSILHNNTSNVIEQTIPYDKNNCYIPHGSYNKICTMTVTVDNDMPSPVYMYYELTNVFQNHREFVKSVSPKQLRGDYEELQGDSLSVCEPLVKGFEDKVLFPCGLQGWSYFNDDITTQINNNNGIVCIDNNVSYNSCSSKLNIALPTDKNFRFKKNAQLSNDPTLTNKVYQLDNYRSATTLPDIMDESLMVWMRMAATPHFKKIHSVINTNLSAGDTITFTIDANFNVAQFGGSKSIVLSTSETYGGKNMSYAWFFLMMGLLCLLSIMLVFSIKFYQTRIHKTPFC